MPIYTTYLAHLKRLSAEQKWQQRSRTYYVMRNRGNNEVAPGSYMLKEYKAGKMTWEEYEKMYREGVGLLTGTPWMQKRAEEAKNDIVILVCYEKDASHCHRRLLAEEIAKRFDAKYEGELP